MSSEALSKEEVAVIKARCVGQAPMLDSDKCLLLISHEQLRAELQRQVDLQDQGLAMALDNQETENETLRIELRKLRAELEAAEKQLEVVRNALGTELHAQLQLKARAEQAEAGAAAIVWEIKDYVKGVTCTHEAEEPDPDNCWVCYMNQIAECPGYQSAFLARHKKYRSALEKVPELVRAEVSRKSAQMSTSFASFNGDSSFEAKCELKIEAETKIIKAITEEIEAALREEAL